MYIYMYIYIYIYTYIYIYIYIHIIIDVWILGLANRYFRHSKYSKALSSMRTYELMVFTSESRP